MKRQREEDGAASGAASSSTGARAASPPAEAEQQLSKEQQAVYDRQLRIWGHKAQLSMTTARVLVAGIGGLACELCKNVILAGIGHVTLMDDALVAAPDLGANFFLSAEDVGKNAAAASRDRAADLNPFVEVCVVEGAAAEQDAAFFADFDVVVVTKHTLAAATAINARCREANRPRFIAANCGGLEGYLFLDLGDSFQFTVPTKKQDLAVGEAQAQDGTETKSYACLGDSMACARDALRGEAVKKTRRERALRVPPALLRVDVGDRCEESWDAAKAAWCEAHSVNPQLIGELAQRPARVEFNPVCAIVGGLAAQELIKTVSAREVPFDNFFVYDGSPSAKHPGVSRSYSPTTLKPAAKAPEQRAETLIV